MAHRNPYLKDQHLSPEVLFLEEIKRALERTRIFTPDLQPGYNPSLKKLCQTEGYIEEFLIESGYWISDYE